ncbi:response regulator [Pseudoalteromonas luteoviolacea]|uniref:response regulator n=1 Tax=Pseudoalteromonas luteoviolacea TaxID=43657 RepID=UPI001B38FD10|nr:response regulator [Pseudoalteromonas luteoviolacea]MBQ4835670.1 response regulator [Pseudoalteromonas luteoviolacea]
MQKFSIMIIDDCEDDRYLLKRVIKKLDISTQIFEADNGETALNFLEDYEENYKRFADDFPPLLIFLDINMPRVNGFEFLAAFHKLREANKNYTSSIFIMFTSSAMEEDKRKTEAYDFVKGFLNKGDLSKECIQESIDSCMGY